MRRKGFLIALVFACSFFTALGQLPADFPEGDPTASVVIHNLSFENGTLSGQVTATNLTEFMLDGDLIITMFKVTGLGRLQHLTLRNFGIIWLDDLGDSETVDFSVEIRTNERAFTQIFTREPVAISGDFLVLATYLLEVEHGGLVSNPPAAIYEFSIADGALVEDE